MEFLKSNLWEIKKSTTLRLFGGLLAITHFLTYWYWSTASHSPLTYHADPSPMCWSLFENCQWVKFLSPAFMEIAFHSFGVLAILAAALFFFTRLTGLAWFALGVALVLKGLLYVQDLRLAANVHYLIFALTLCFLLIPAKIHVLRWLLISYYVASGLLDLSPNWLTGSWFVNQLHVPVKLAEWLAAMAVLAQMLAPVALWFRNLRNFLIAYLCLIVYHALMWYADGFFEPLVMLLLLQLFPLHYYEERKVEREFLYQSFIRPEPSKAWVWITMIVFWALQAIPYAPHNEIPALKLMEGTLALATVAAEGECRQTTFLVEQGALAEIALESPKDRPQVFRCNAYLRFLDLKNACEIHREDPNFKTLIAFFETRSLREPAYKIAFQSYDICNDQLKFHDVTGSTNGL